MVAAVGVHFLSGNGSARLDGMVAPLPDKAPADAVVLLNQLKVILQVAGAVAHGVTVLTHHIGKGAVLLKILMDFRQSRVHPAVHIQIAEIAVRPWGIAGRLIVGQTGGIKFLCPLKRLLKGAAISAFVAHGPDYHAGTVLVPLHTALGSVHRCLGKFRVIRNGSSPESAPFLPVRHRGINRLGSMALIVRLINHIKAQTVIELVSPGCIGIVAGTDSIYIMLLHHLKILLKLLHTDGKACHRIAVMAVGSPEFHLPAV